MNNIKPDNYNNFENKHLVHRFFAKLNKMYNFKMAPALIALSTQYQLGEIVKLGFPFLEDYEDLINNCVDDQACSELDEVVQNSGKVSVFP